MLTKLVSRRVVNASIFQRAFSSQVSTNVTEYTNEKNTGDISTMSLWEYSAQQAGVAA